MIRRSLLLLLPLLVAPASADRPPIVPTEWLVAGPIPGGGRVSLAASPAYLRYFHQAATPQAGATIDLGGGRATSWRAARAAGGALRGRELVSAYCYTRIVLEQPARMVVEARGSSRISINGEQFAGEVYRHGFFRAPVLLRRGANHVLLHAVRGALDFRLVPPTAPIELNLKDVTRPDLRQDGAARKLWIGLPLLNTTGDLLRGATLRCGDGDLFEQRTVALPPLAPLAILKLAVELRMKRPVHKTARFELPLVIVAGKQSHEARVPLDVVTPQAPYRLTYRSEVDGSVQYCAVLPPTRFDPARRYALVLSLHGAGVEAIGQARAYSAKDWAVLVAPTNRRRFGFDWEDWGRTDALEALAAAGRHYLVDPQRVYLVGHSMGGHGTWHVGATHPGRFAAIGPSAGWASFWSYGGALRDRSAPGVLLRRAIGGSDTWAIERNLSALGVFLIHGEKDDNVPFNEARMMLERLKAFHRDFRFHIEPGAGHWWNGKQAAGADCVDLPALWDFCRSRRRNPDPQSLDFSTASLWINHRHRWIELRLQQQLHALSRIRARKFPHRRGYEFSTDNVAGFRFDPAATGPGKLAVTIDGERLEHEWRAGPVEALRGDKGWSLRAPVETTGKHPGRYGPFKQAFSNRFVLVYGTGGTAAEQRAALERARYDAGLWWYRGNGQALLVPDSAFDEKAHAGRNWVLYGNETNNAVWGRLAAAWPLRVQAGRIALGQRSFDGPGLACLAALPHPTDPRTLVGLIGGSGAEGIRLSGSARYFLSGTGLPDLTIWDAELLAGGRRRLLATGYLDAQWGLGKAELFFR